MSCDALDQRLKSALGHQMPSQCQGSAEVLERLLEQTTKLEFKALQPSWHWDVIGAFEANASGAFEALLLQFPLLRLRLFVF